MSLAPVQHDAGIHGSSIPGAITIGGTPVVGNLLIALIGVNTTSYTVGAGWTQFDAAVTSGSSTTNMVALYRYVQGGDTSTLPAFFSAGTTYWTHQVWEVPNVTGTWTTDFLCSFPLPGVESNQAIVPLPIFADGLALSGTASYNGTTNPSITGSWTLDDANNNNSNFGSAAGAHRVVANGDTLDGTWTQGSSTPFSGIVILLTTIQPASGVYPRHTFRQSGAGGLTADIPLPWDQKVGSLLIAYLAYGAPSDGSPTIDAGNWTEFSSTSDAGGKRFLSLYRYVGGGDGFTLPRIASAGAAFNQLTVIELNGASGTFSTDHVSNQHDSQDSGTSQTTSADATTANNQFALLAYGNYNGGGQASTTGFDGYLTRNADGGYGSYFLAFKFFPSSGSSVQGTITPDTTTHPQSYSQDIFQRGSAAVSATGSGNIATDTTSPPGAGGSIMAAGGIGTVTATAPTASASGKQARTSQEALQVLYATALPPASTTQEALQVLYTENQPARSTELVLQVLWSGPRRVRRIGMNIQSKRIVPFTNPLDQDAWPNPHRDPT